MEYVNCFISFCVLLVTIFIYVKGPYKRNIIRNIESEGLIRKYVSKNENSKEFVIRGVFSNDSCLGKIERFDGEGIFFETRGSGLESQFGFCTVKLLYKDIIVFCEDGFDAENRPVIICKYRCLLSSKGKIVRFPFSFFISKENQEELHRKFFLLFKRKIESNLNA